MAPGPRTPCSLWVVSCLLVLLILMPLSHSTIPGDVCIPIPEESRSRRSTSPNNRSDPVELIDISIHSGDSHMTAICACVDNGDQGVHVDCTGLDLDAVPPGFPINTTRLTLTNNKIRRIRSTDFYDIQHLVKLYLDGNEIAQIENGAFRNQLKLKQLIMHHNKLPNVTRDMFASLKEIQIIDLRENLITSIHHHSLALLEDLTEVELRSNPLLCDCDTLRLRTWMFPDVFLIDARCANINNSELVEVADHQFGDCPKGPVVQTCLQCRGEPSLAACEEFGQQRVCTSAMDGCETSVTVTGGVSSMVTSCQHSSLCVNKFSNNLNECIEGAGNQHCTFCCVGADCNRELPLDGYTYQTPFELEFALYRLFSERFLDLSSDEYITLTEEIKSKIEKTLSGLYGHHDIEPKSFSDGSTVCLVSIISTVSMDISIVELQDDMYVTLQNAVASHNISMDIIPGTIRLRSPATCSPETHENIRGLFRWLPTWLNKTSTIACPYPKHTGATAHRTCLTDHSGLPVWGRPVEIDCQIPSDTTRILKDLVNKPVTNDTVEEISRDLANVTQTGPELSSVDIDYTTQVAERLLGTFDVKLPPKAAEDLLNVYNNLMHTKIDMLTLSQRNFGAPERMLMAIDKMATKSDFSKTQCLVASHVAVSMLDLKDAANTGTPATLSVSRLQHGQEFDKDKVALQQVDHVTPGDVEISLSVPASVLQDAMLANLTLQFHLFHNDKFFKALQQHNDNGTNQQDITTSPPDANSSHVQKNVINSRVVAANFGHQPIGVLREPITIVLRNQKDGKSARCVHWDFNTSTWSEAGCHVTDHVAGEYTICKCDHLTNFALIMDIYGTGAGVSAANAMALSVISYVGCAVSLVGLLLTLATYCFFRKLRRDNPSRILMNLCGALCGVLILFLVSTAPSVQNSAAGCVTTAVLLHYCLLAAWMWMAIEAFYMYLALVKVLNTYFSHFLIKCCAIGWGLPVILVIITVAISRENYGFQGGICWLSRGAFFGAVLTPILILLILNTVAFGLVVHTLRKLKENKALERSRKFTTTMQLKGAVSVMVLLGLTWVFAVFAVGRASLAFQYLFCIFNSLQGLFIFIFYCAMKPDVRTTWKSKWTEVTSSAEERLTSYGTSKGTDSYGRSTAFSTTKTTLMRDSPVGTPSVSKSRKTSHGSKQDESSTMDVTQSSDKL